MPSLSNTGIFYLPATTTTPPKLIILTLPCMGLDVVRPFKPSSSCGHVFILAAIDYFSKWAEVIPLGEVGVKQVADFIGTHLIYKYGVPHKIISDNALYFKNQVMIRLAEKYNFRHDFSSSYNPSSNGQVEAFNKVIYKILKKMVSRSRRDWHERLPEALWAIGTTIRMTTGCTPYNLVFSSEVMLLPQGAITIPKSGHAIH